MVPGGSAVLTEYGYLDRMPEAVSFGDHSEFTIHFGHLQQVADKLNLKPLLQNLGEMLSFDLAFPILDLRSQNTLLKALLPELGYETPPTLAYSREMLSRTYPEVSDVMHLDARPLQDIESLTPFRFFALVVHRQLSTSV